MIKSKLETKDMEIELLNTEGKEAYNTIEQLQHRVTEMEEHCETSDHYSSAVRPASSDTYFYLGDINLGSILLSHLNHNCQVRTITDANMDLFNLG